MRFTLAAASLSAVVASAASADIVVTLTNQSFAGFSFSQFVNYAGGQEVVGTLTGASINVTLNSSTNYTFADDLCVYVDVEPLGPNGKLQIGGFSSLGAPTGFRYFWPNGGSDAPGATSVGTVNLTTSLAFTGNRAVDGTIWIGNGYGFTGASGTWTGTVTLHGVNVIPAPGALALLGLAGLAARRRRS
jgi:hypothetical protein